MANDKPPAQYTSYEETVLTTSQTTPFSLYGELIKTKQTFLLVYTTIFAYLITAWVNNFNVMTFLWLITGLFLAVSGSTLLNMYIDRDIDSLMKRTKERALPSGKIPPYTVLKHGLLFTIAGGFFVGVFVNALTMLVVFLGAFFDIVVYSFWLKRRTRYSIVFGGLAGGFPALAGVTAVTNSITVAGILMGLFVVCWIPLHFLTLALIPENLSGYQEANIPVWPIVRGQTETIQVITISAIISSILIISTGFVLSIELILLTPLLVINAFVLYLAVKNLITPSQKLSFKIFKTASILMAFAFLWFYIALIGTTLFF